ncbi:MAG TPA: hypothetical protein ENL03_06615, partial [Phycisphaerae bacterium]|nr:hypothetical protein [Phycisphaerae bacterium]
MNSGLKNSKWKEILCLGAVLAVVAATRITGIARADNIARDGTIYLTMAQEMFVAKPVETFNSYDYHPGYSIVIAGLARITGASWPDGWILVAQCISASMSILTLLGVYYITKTLFSQKTALLSVMVFGLSMEFTKISCDVLSDSMSVAMA